MLCHPIFRPPTELPRSLWSTRITHYCCATPLRRSSKNVTKLQFLLHSKYILRKVKRTIPDTRFPLKKKIHCLRLKKSYYRTKKRKIYRNSIYTSWRKGMRYTPTNFSSRFRNGRIYTDRYTRVASSRFRVRMRNSDEKKNSYGTLWFTRHTKLPTVHCTAANICAHTMGPMNQCRLQRSSNANSRPRCIIRAI